MQTKEPGPTLLCLHCKDSVWFKVNCTKFKYGLCLLGPCHFSRWKCIDNASDVDLLSSTGLNVGLLLLYHWSI